MLYIHTYGSELLNVMAWFEPEITYARLASHLHGLYTFVHRKMDEQPGFFFIFFFPSFNQVGVSAFTCVFPVRVFCEHCTNYIMNTNRLAQFSILIAFLSNGNESPLWGDAFFLSWLLCFAFYQPEFMVLLRDME